MQAVVIYIEAGVVMGVISSEPIDVICVDSDNAIYKPEVAINEEVAAILCNCLS